MLNAIICVWNEEDIIASCVANAFAQGCDRVFILDNASTDTTVQQAIGAGAVYHATFKTDEFDETQKTVYLNKCVLGINEQLPDERNRWLYTDADEFPDFDTGKTIKETLREMPPEVRAVGGYACDHIPTHEPYYVPGLHPADCMPVGTPDKEKPWKFNLLRHDKDKPPMYSRSGSHTYNSNGGEVVEAQERFLIHHFRYRRPEVTKARLKALVSPNAEGKRRVDWYDRMSVIDGKERSQYHDRPEQMDRMYIKNKYGNLKTEALPYNFSKIVRWYDPLSITITSSALNETELAIWRGTQAYFMRDFNRALLAFNHAFEAETDALKAGLLLASMTRCYVHLDDPTHITIVDILRKSPHPEVRSLVSSIGVKAPAS